MRNQKTSGYQSTPSDLATRHRRAVPARPARRPSGEISNARRSATTRGRRSKAAVFGRLWRATRTGLAFALAVGIVAGGALAYRSFATSRFFTLRNVDLRGDIRAPRAELISALYENTPNGLWWTNLEELRGKLRQHSWVRDAEVVRVLPDTLRVTITEREPYTIARLGSGALVWVDRDGVILDEQGAFKSSSETDRGLPLLTGLDEGTDKKARDANRTELQSYTALVDALEQGQPPLLDRVDEVAFDELEGVHLQLTGRRVKVIANPNDIASQLKKALAVIDAVDRGDLSALELFKVTDAAKLVSGGHLSYVDTRAPNRVVMGLAH
ncbi:MAG: FtsQ-type POTRA domain-containing protein [Acidobacteriota bacterium]